MVLVVTGAEAIGITGGVVYLLGWVALAQGQKVCNVCVSLSRSKVQKTGKEVLVILYHGSRQSFSPRTHEHCPQEIQLSDRKYP